MRIVRFSSLGKRFLIIGIALACILGSIPSKPVEAALPMTGDASLYYSDQANASSPYKFYTSLTNTWTSQANMGTESNAVHFVRTVSSPVRNEKLTMLSDTNGQYKLYRWNGSSWSVDWTDSGGGGSSTTYTPRFDIAYDYLGNALVVYSNNAATTNQMAYRKYTGSTSSWGAKTNFTAAGTNAPGNTRHIRIETRPGTDEYAIVWADYQQNLSGNYFKWSTDTFAGEPASALMDWLSILMTGTEIQAKAFDIAFEASSGELLVCYNSDGGTDLYCNQRTAGMAGTWQARNVYGTAFDADEIDLAPDPNPASNQVALYRYGAASQDGGAAIWDGGGWGYPSVFDDTMGTLGVGTSNGSVGWVRSGGNSRAVITYDDAATSSGVDWVVWNGISWIVQTDDTSAFSTAGANDIWHELVADPNNPAQLASIIVDSAADIGVKRLTFNGTTFVWSAMDNAGSSHNTNMHTTGGWTAAFAWAGYVMPAVLSVDIVDGSGNGVASPSVNMTSVSSSSTCQSTSGTLGTSSQKIRVSNGTANASWSLGVAATGGPQAKWTATTDTMDYNDGSSMARSLWDDTAVPATLDSDEGMRVELGLKFRSEIDTSVKGVRFYKGPNNTGTHIGRLYSMNGTQMAQVTFTDETASGWQEALFSSPVEINANTTYMISYHSPSGHFSANNDYFANESFDNYPLSALVNGEDGPNGMYRDGPGGVMPDSNWLASNYWVDVVIDLPDDPAGCEDGVDADTEAGRLTLNPSVGSITPESSCNSTGVTTPSSNSFSEGSTNSVGLLNGSSSATRGCYWDLTNVGINQVIPKYKFPGTYTLPLTLTVTAT